MAKPGRLLIANSRSHQSLNVLAVDGWQLKATSQAAKCTVWLQSAEGDMIELESDLCWLSPVLSHLLNCGVGFSRSNPICLPPKVAAEGMKLFKDYFQFINESNRSAEECDLFVYEFVKKDTPTLLKLGHAANYLQLEGAVDTICDALAQNIGKNSGDVKKDFIKYFEKCAKGQVLQPQENLNCDSRIRNSNKLLGKQKKDIKDLENVKKAEGKDEAHRHEERSVDDLISFINGGDGDTKGIGTLKRKKKKNGKKGKDKFKNSSDSVIPSSVASATKNVTNNGEEDIHASSFANHSGTTTDSLNILSTQIESFNVEGDTGDDREVDAFKRRLTSIVCPKKRLVLTDGIKALIRTRLLCLMKSNLSMSTSHENDL
nr:PREDICTED: SKP1-like protein 21 [Daucus carota subsp. sativus]